MIPLGPIDPCVPPATAIAAAAPVSPDKTDAGSEVEVEVVAGLCVAAVGTEAPLSIVVCWLMRMPRSCSWTFSIEVSRCMRLAISILDSWSSRVTIASKASCRLSWSRCPSMAPPPTFNPGAGVPAIRPRPRPAYPCAFPRPLPRPPSSPLRSMNLRFSAPPLKNPGLAKLQLP